MDIAQLIVSLVSGIIGGNVAGAAMPEDKNLGGVGNSVAGFFGGGIGGYILQALGLFAQNAAHAVNTTGAANNFDISTLLGNIGGSGVGGAVLMIIAGLIKNAMKK